MAYYTIMQEKETKEEGVEDLYGQDAVNAAKLMFAVKKKQ